MVRRVSQASLVRVALAPHQASLGIVASQGQVVTQARAQHQARAAKADTAAKAALAGTQVKALRLALAVRADSVLFQDSLA